MPDFLVLCIFGYLPESVVGMASKKPPTTKPRANRNARPTLVAAKKARKPAKASPIPPTPAFSPAPPAALNTNEPLFDQPDAIAKRLRPQPPKLKPPRKPLHIMRHLKRFLRRWKLLLLIGGGLIAVTGIALSPVCYPLWSQFITHDVELSVIDTELGLPVPNVVGSLDGQPQPEASTGVIKFTKVPTGRHTILISRDGYRPSAVHLRLSPISGRQQRTVNLDPTGQLVVITAVDTLSRRPITGATITAPATTATTNSAGQASIAIDPSITNFDITITADHYTTQTLTNLSAADNHTIALTPAGRAYYFHRTDTVTDLYSMNLDGTDAKVVLPGTVTEAVPPTMARSPDGRWLAFTSNREGSQAGGVMVAKLYLLDTASDSLLSVGTDYARYKITGWTPSNQLIYFLERITSDFQPANKFQLRRYNPADQADYSIYSNRSLPTNTNKNYKRDQEGYVGIYEELYGDPILTHDYLAYVFRREAKPGFGHLLPPRSYIVIADLNGATLRTVRQNTGVYLTLKDMGNNRISYVDYSSGEKYYELDLTTGIEALLPKNESAGSRVYYSPDGSRKAWIESASGTNTIKVALADGSQERTVAVGFALTIQSWFGNKYLLLDGADTAFSLSVVAIEAGPPLKLTEYIK